MDSMPCDESMEKMLLCCIALRPQILDEGSIIDSVFYIPAHTLIFKHFVEVYSEKNTLEFIIVKASFSPDELSEIGGVENLSEIYGMTLVHENWQQYHQILVDLLAMRVTKDACVKILRKMEDGSNEWNQSVREYAEKAMTAMMLKGPNMSKEVYLRDHLIEQLDLCVSSTAQEYMVPSGIRALNLALGGLLPGDQMIIAAETSLGKTTLALNIAEHVALEGQKKKVAIFSFEMSVPDIRCRIMASGAEVPLNDIRFKNLTKDHVDKISNFISRIPKERTLYLLEGYSLDITEIVSRCRHMKFNGGLDMVVVDYLQLVNPSITKEANRQREIADISRRLKVMAGELGIVVIALSQLNDDGKLRESRAIGQDADIILFILDGKSDDALERTIRIGKNRHGASGAKVAVHFYGSYVKFTDKA